jgi:hypothetical protein
MLPASYGLSGPALGQSLRSVTMNTKIIPLPTILLLLIVFIRILVSDVTGLQYIG